MRWYNDEKTNEIRMKVQEIIATAKEDGVIYNTDYNLWKDKASRAIDSALDGAKRDTYLSKDYDQTKDETDLYYGLSCLTVTNFPSKKLASAIEQHDTPFYQAVKSVIADWSEISDGFKEIKELIVKGKKPSTTPRKTKERTIENTGTCSCCGRNIKLEGGKIVHHGFTIRHGGRFGTCPGVGHFPWEVSSEGKIEFIKSLETYLEGRKEVLVSVQNATVLTRMEGYGRNQTTVKVKMDDAGFNRLRDMKIANIQNEIRHVENDIHAHQKMVDGWEAQPLPDAK